MWSGFFLCEIGWGWVVTTKGTKKIKIFVSRKAAKARRKAKNKTSIRGEDQNLESSKKV